MKKVVRLLAFCLILSGSLWAGSIHLFNDSPYSLRAVIRGADGSYLGEMIVLPQRTMTWTDILGQPVGPNSSLTPYMVLWYCMSGNEYAICANVSPGATVVASGCDGDRICPPPRPPPPKQPPKAPGQHPELLPEQSPQIQQDYYEQKPFPPPDLPPTLPPSPNP